MRRDRQGPRIQRVLVLLLAMVVARGTIMAQEPVAKMCDDQVTLVSVAL